MMCRKSLGSKAYVIDRLGLAITISANQFGYANDKRVLERP